MTLLKPLLAATALLATTVGAQANILQSFDTDAQGWTATGGTLSYQATGGNGGGYVQLADGDDFELLLNAPAALLGNGLSYLNGTLGFDAKNINGDSANWNTFGLITISNGALSVTADIGADGQPPADGQWHHYSVLLSTAAFGADLPAVLANVTAFSITGEFHAGVSEVVGFDNISVSAVPEPTSAALMALGLGGLLLGARRRR